MVLPPDFLELCGATGPQIARGSGVQLLMGRLR